MKRTAFGIVLGAAALAATTLSIPTTATAASGSSGAVPVTEGSVDWGTCASDTMNQRGFQCGSLEVPLDHENPDGKTITLALSRIRHTVPDDEYQGVMLVNPGGPGGSGLTLPILTNYVPDGAGAAYDWIGFDPRGVGSSEPALSCDPDYAGYNRPRYVPTTKAIEKTWKSKAYGYAKDCARNNKGGILKHLTTVDTVEDMDLIRKALGQKQINYLGFSYGTYLGQVYSTLYPSKVRRQVFDGTVDPRDVWYEANLNQDVAFDKNINIWFGWLARHDDVYDLGSTRKQVSDLFYATQEKLYKHPVTAQGGKLGGSEWTDAFLYAGYYQSTWTDLADTFSAFINQDDVDALEASYLDASGFGDDNGYAVYLGVQCSDTAWPQRWSTWKKDNDRIHAKAPFETWANAWYNAPCLYWPAKASTPVKVSGKKVASTLMINETLDAATPYAGSLEVRKRFPNARLIAEPGGTTHSGSLSGNACVDDRIADYLATGKLPKRKSGNRADVECAPLPQPEPESATAQRKSLSAPDGLSRLDLQKLTSGRS